MPDALFNGRFDDDRCNQSDLFYNTSFQNSAKDGLIWSNEVSLLQALAKIGEVIQTLHMD
jgi:hypothetical protein